MELRQISTAGDKKVVAQCGELFEVRQFYQ